MVLYNLRRVEAGLRGERVVGVEEGHFEEEDREGDGGALAGIDLESGGAAGAKAADTDGGADGAGNNMADAEAATEMETEWQDRGEWEREQEDVQGELGERDHGVGEGEGGGVPRVQRADRVARKAEKAERRKRVQREREERRKRERDAEVGGKRGKGSE